MHSFSFSSLHVKKQVLELRVKVSIHIVHCLEVTNGIGTTVAVQIKGYKETMHVPHKVIIVGLVFHCLMGYLLWYKPVNALTCGLSLHMQIM